MIVTVDHHFRCVDWYAAGCVADTGATCTICWHCDFVVQRGLVFLLVFDVACIVCLLGSVSSCRTWTWVARMMFR